MQTQIYLFFDGRCQEALDFYKAKLGIEVEMLMRFKDAPADPDASADPNCGQPPANMDAVMHSSFSSAARASWPPTAMRWASPSSRALHCRSRPRLRDEADKLFDAMSSEGGKVTQPLIKTFFSPKFGMLEDKFGVNWMVVVEQKQ